MVEMAEWTFDFNRLKVWPTEWSTGMVFTGPFGGFWSMESKFSWKSQQHTGKSWDTTISSTIDIYRIIQIYTIYIYINTYIYIYIHIYIYTYYNIISTTVSFNVCKFPFPKNMSRFPCLKSHEVHPIHPHLHRPGAGPGHHSAHPRRWRPCRRSFSGAPSDFHGNWRYKAMGFPLL